MSEDQNKAIVRDLIEAINQGDEGALEDLVANDIVVHGQGGQEFRGTEVDISSAVDNPAFPDSHLEIRSMIAEDDTVAVRMTFTGTHEGNMGGIEPTGEEIEIRVMGMYRIVDEQLDEVWFVEDDAATLQQLGLWQELTG